MMNWANEVINEVGEMVIESGRCPPCLCFSGMMYPGDTIPHQVILKPIRERWRHGDWIKIYEDGSLEIHGRSDATLNRKGVRIGTSEIYAILDGIDRNKGQPYPEFGDWRRRCHAVICGLCMDEEDLTDGQSSRDQKNLTLSQGSPRHVPDRIRASP